MDRGTPGNTGRRPSVITPLGLVAGSSSVFGCSRSTHTLGGTPVKISSRLSRPTRTATVALVSAAAGIALGLPGLALATHSGQDVPAPPASPTRAGQIQNIDQVRTAIKGYYGDTLTSVTDPVPDGSDYSYQGDTATTQ